MQAILKKAGFVATLFVGACALFVLGSFVPVDGNYTFRIVESGSMEPAIKTGSVIALIPRAQYEEGDVITFSGSGRNSIPTTHRIVGIEKSGEGMLYVTKGDANEETDYRRVREEEILGKVFLTVPYTGFVAVFLATPNGKAVLAVIVVIALLYLYIPWKKIFIQKNNP